MSASKRESWGSLRKLPSGRWQARYPGPDGETYTARTEGDEALTFLTKTDARTWLAAVHAKISLGQWNPPAAVAAQNRAEAPAQKARSMGFEEYSERWVQMIKTELNRSGKIRAIATVRSYQKQGQRLPHSGVRRHSGEGDRREPHPSDDAATRPDPCAIESKVEIQRDHAAGADRAHDDFAPSGP